jgi:type II secretory pathway pseudopilin PulG
MVCGSHLQAGPPAGKTGVGAGAIVAIVCGVVFGGIVLVAILASMLLPALARAKAKANRVKCVNNVGNVYKAGLAFAQDNGERLPWQLSSSGVRNHLDGRASASVSYGISGNSYINEVPAHPNSLAAAGVYGLNAMKAELVTPKILHSPCDAMRAGANEIVQGNWGSYDTKAQGVSAELGNGVSYVLCRGADTRRPSAVYALTRNWSDDQLNTGEWLGSDSDPGNARTIAGLTASQGQCVTMDGGAMQSNNADFQSYGRLTKAANTATGGVARGKTSLNLIRGPGL